MIIHQLAPANKDDWHPLWFHCHKSWITNFTSASTIILWNDEEIDSLVSSAYPEYYSLFKSFPFQINRVDFARFCILHRYGGLYADMDMYCYKDFSKELSEECYLVESTLQQEVVQNSLMASIPRHSFFIECMNKCKEYFEQGLYAYEKSNITTRESNDYVLKVTGPRLLSDVYQATNSKVNKLPASLFNPGYEVYNSDIRTKHMMTGRWGTEMMDIKKQEHEKIKEVISHQDYLKADYKGFRNIDLDNFSFNNSYKLS